MMDVTRYSLGHRDGLGDEHLDYMYHRALMAHSSTSCRRIGLSADRVWARDSVLCLPDTTRHAGCRLTRNRRKGIQVISVARHRLAGVEVGTLAWGVGPMLDVDGQHGHVGPSTKRSR